MGSRSLRVQRFKGSKVQGFKGFKGQESRGESRESRGEGQEAGVEGRESRGELNPIEPLLSWKYYGIIYLASTSLGKKNPLIQLGFTIAI